MQEDRPSETALYVALGRAVAHARGLHADFDDPFALGLLPEEYRSAVAGARWPPPRSLREAWLRGVAEVTQRIMLTRTLAIDAGLREGAPWPQLVLLGAGLDARAYRMPELAESTVFEVDHPATQRYKRAAVGELAPRARALRYVPVDFTRERFTDALERAGHSTRVRTAWVFEGVVTYLTLPELEVSLAGMAQRSAPGSRVLLTYNEGGRVRSLLGAVTARVGEPQRSSFRPEAMRALVEKHGLRVREDLDGLERAARFGLALSRLEARGQRFHRVLTAERS